MSQEQQHKKLAELTKLIYVSRLQGAPSSALADHYTEICSWLNFPQLSDGSLATLADRYHEHLSLAKKQLREHNLLPAISKGDKATSIQRLPIALYLDHIRSAHNVGSILRTVEAFALGKVYFSPGMALANHKQVKDAAMGAANWIEWEQIEDLALLPRPLIVLETSSHSLYDYPFPTSFTLALGNEEYGCSPALLAAADSVLAIPLYGKKNSLNVANAFAIAAAEIMRQRYFGKPNCQLPQMG